MFIMLEISTTDFTGLAMEAKNTLDKFFRIPLKEEAIDIVEKMKERNTKLYADSLSDLDNRLVEILSNDQTYLSKNFVWRPDGKKAVKSLFEKSYEDAKAEEDKKPYGERKVVSIYRDIERNFTTIKEYETYVNNLKSVKELDKLFLRNLNAIYTEYRSSTDYMSRLVRRLLKYNFKYSDENIKDVETRVLILRRLINAYGYDCVNEISTPELENIVMKDFGGDVEKITDDIFRYLEEDRERGVYDKKYVTALVELQATIIYKSSTIPMTEELCKELCTLICKEATLFEKKTKTIKKYEKKILTDSAINGTAKLLKECFYEPSTFSIQFIKDYKNADINKILAFKQKLDSKYKKGKKAMRESFSDIDESIRLGILFKNFSDRINVSERIVALFAIAFSKKITLQEGKVLKDCFTEENLKTIKSIKQRNIIKDSEKYTAIKELLEECEKCLNTQEKEQYLDLIYKKIGDRFNGAKNPSKKDNLYKSANEIFGINIADYKMLKIADDLANARFSPHGKTREYLYIFAIAFEMTSTGYTEDATIIDEKTGAEIIDEDPRKITDIQKNLFFDYYTDNIVNRLETTAGFNKSKINVSVDGYGINYKNFSEVTFLWCIRQQNLTPKEKLELAYEIIEHCKEKGKSVEKFKKPNVDFNEENITKIYKEYYKNAEIYIKDKSYFQEFLINNYPCRFNGNITMLNGDGLSAGIELEKQQERVNKLLQIVEANMFDSGVANIAKIIEEIIERDNENNDITRIFVLRHYLRELRCENCERGKGKMFPNCYEFFKPYSWLDKSGKERKITTCEDLCADKKYDAVTLRKSLRNIAYIGDDCEGDFERRLTRLSNLCKKEQTKLKNTLQAIENRVNINVLYLEKKDVSRTAIIALCYFEMVLMNYLYRLFSENINKTIDIETFEEFYERFCEGRTVTIIGNDEADTEIELYYPGADKILEKAGYQKINSKNMLDVYVIFLAYRDNYIKLFELPNATELINYAKKINKKLKEMKKEIEKDKIYEDDISKDR